MKSLLLLARSLSLVALLSLSCPLSVLAEDPPAAGAAGSEAAKAVEEGKKDEAKPEAKVEEKADADKGDKKAKGKEKAKKESGPAKQAVIHTTAGKITVKLFPDRAPKTVENFLGLASGKKEWTDPTDNKKKSKPLYNGTIFHRVIPGFMIQGGDPEGTGRGGPGYTFEDETKPSDSFDKPGILAMANAGPNTNGSQFFITVKATPWLNGRHTIFGEVTSGMDVVEKIVGAPRDGNDRPNKPVKITKIDAK
jgi:peptidyl-prolyl cis-trans isomerase A (cyclophilin A)